MDIPVTILTDNEERHIRRGIEKMEAWRVVAAGNPARVMKKDGLYGNRRGSG
jgi:hypothetical protein